jgi:hypothetical protein
MFSSYRTVNTHSFDYRNQSVSSVEGNNDWLLKAIPLQAWSGPKVSRKLRFPGFMTTARDGGKVVSLTHRPPLPPGNAPDAHFC